jgi:hypothetical protein
MYGIDPLDPKNLNTPPTPVELNNIQKTLTQIDNSNAEELAETGKEYKNFPEKTTGAALPPSAGGYLSFPVGSRAVTPNRLIIDTSTGAIYYTNNHYLSFYHLNLTGGSH